MQGLTQNYEGNSKKATLMRLISMLLYIIIILIVSSGIQISLQFLHPLYQNQLLNDKMLTYFNLGFPIIPFPFNPSAIIVALHTHTIISGWEFITIGGGLLFFILITWSTYKRALKYLTNTYKGKLVTEKSIKEKKTTINDIRILTMTQKKAFFY